ncbi:MAG: hypothetical protein OEL83_09895 [Desulforhopalus sp.]|nr:hypothetical protein [Desulforhopalus sp.]
MDEQPSISHLELTISSGKLPLFTTVFQSGIEITTPAGSSLGQFLGALPGFTSEYLAGAVQTIFLNGVPVDDLTIPLEGDRPTVALSAAMPGLAGAIFRKNSFHAALRSDTKLAHAALPDTPKVLTVTLKLFNTIALDRGEELLRGGVQLPAGVFAAFLSKRPELSQAILRIQLDDREFDIAALQRQLALAATIHLKISAAEVQANG